MICQDCRFYRASTYEYAGASGTPLGFCQIKLPPMLPYYRDHERGIRCPDSAGCDLGQPANPQH